jgi:hypothetical protein
MLQILDLKTSVQRPISRSIQFSSAERGWLFTFAGPGGFAQDSFAIIPFKSRFLPESSLISPRLKARGYKASEATIPPAARCKSVASRRWRVDEEMSKLNALSAIFWIKLCYHGSMIVREAKLKHGTAEQYSAIDEAIRTAQFIRNKAVRHWMDNQGVNKADLYSICKDLAKE